MGEHTVGEDPDCNNEGRNCANPKITRTIIDPSKQIIIHEQFRKRRNKDYRKDIALIRLNEPVPLFNEDSAISSVEPVCLPWLQNDAARNLDDGHNALVTGWGRTKNQTIPGIRNVVQSKTLLKVKVPIANNHCRKEGGKFDIDACTNFLNQTCQICAGGKIGKRF